jgi:hypothetical protein
MKKLLLFLLVFILEGFILWGVGKLSTASGHYLASNSPSTSTSATSKAGF